MYAVFAKLLEEKGCTVADVARATGVGESTLSNWKKRNGRLSTANLSKIADFFEVPVDVFFGRETESGQKYYFSDETAQAAQELFENRELRILFDAARDSKPENLEMAAELLRRLKGTNPDE